MTSLNLASILVHSAMLSPEAVAITFGSVSRTYAQLDADASKVAAGLVSLGIAPGDHVALSCPNLPSFPADPRITEQQVQLTLDFKQRVTGAPSSVTFDQIATNRFVDAVAPTMH